jgi:hypothetical protein
VTIADLQTWEIRYPSAGATGVEIARARIDPVNAIWVHAVPGKLAVSVRQGDDRLLAHGEPLERNGPAGPMTRLAVEGDRVTREDRWPTDVDLGSIVILPGGEAGVLTAWWNAEDGSAWRWSVEFSNRR